MISRVLLLTGYLWNTPVRYIWVIFGGLLSSPGGMLNKSTRNERQVMSFENTASLYYITLLQTHYNKK
jgi:hypothetical protein